MQYKRRGFWCTKNNRRVVGETVKSRSTYFSPRAFLFVVLESILLFFLLVEFLRFVFYLRVFVKFLFKTCWDIRHIYYAQIESKFQSCFYFNGNVFIVCIPDPFSFTSCCAPVKGAIFEKKEKEDHFCVWSSFLAKNLQWVLQVEKSPRKRGLYAK